MKYLFRTLCLLLCCLGISAQELQILPQLQPVGGSYDDRVKVSCTFPEGCAGGKYWVNGGQIAAKAYEGPITLETTTRLSVAGVNKEGRIITDIVTQDYVINKVTAPYVTTSPEVNTARESFYATTLYWNNAESTSLDVSDFKDGGSRAGQPALWLVYEPTQEVISTGTHGGLWLSATNTYKAYLYKNYRPTNEGAYTLHIAKGVFVVDGKHYDEELVFKYFVGQDQITAPVFSPVGGTYDDKVEVSITYPKNAFYQFYQIEGQNRQNYTGPFTVTESCTIKAWGRNEDFSEETETSTASYTIIPVAFEKEELPEPIFSREGNTISITESASNTIIKYWLDNRMQNAQIYTGPFTVDRNCIISAVAYRENGISPTVDYTVSDFIVDTTDLGLSTLRTPEEWASVHVTGMSPNGRFVCGYTDASGTPRGFLWDITSGRSSFISTSYFCRALGVSDDGTIYGWRVDSNAATGETTSTSDENLFYGYFRNGEWTRQPSGMKVEGITADNVLYGSFDNHPALYDIKTQTQTVYPGAYGSIKCASADGSVLAGWVSKDGKRTPAYWTDGNTNPITVETERQCAVVSISGNGLWMLMDNEEWGAYCDIAGYRYDVYGKKLETLTSMGARYPSRYEWMHSIANDGTLFGVYDHTLILREVGKALAYTTDGVWMDVADILAERGYVDNELSIVASKLVSADQNTFILTVFPSEVNIEDACYSALAVKFDAVLNHAAPTNVKASQMFGMTRVKLTWEAPLSGAESVVSYKVMRDGSLLQTVGKDTFEYFDGSVENQTEYSYSVVAVYDDDVESEPSFPSTVKVIVEEHLAVRSIAVRQSGINDVNLFWQAPIVTLPKLQYFDEESEFAAFGTSGYDSEWAIRVPASEVGMYDGMKIRTFQFLPTGVQDAFELRLYKGEAGTADYDADPFYTQTIDPSTLKYGTVNTIEIDTPQELPVGNDLLVALYIKQKGNANMLGVSHEGFKPGYTDLCRVVGVHDKFVSISESSSTTTEIVVPVGVGIASDESLRSSMVEHYEISDNEVVLGSTEAIRFRIENVEEGEHSFAVRALYQDGVYSVPTTLTYDLKKNEEAFVPVSDLKVEMNAEGKAEFSWKAPLNEDKTLIHWGDLTPSEGLKYEGYPVFTVASVYPVTMTSTYADEYEITHLYFYPTADAWFRLYLDDNVEHVFFDKTFEEVEVNKLNFIPLDEPITIDASINYRLAIDVDNCPISVAPLAFDSSNQSADGYSNMLNAGLDWMTLNDVLQIDEHPNWLMGLVIRQKNAKEMPLEGYNVVVDGQSKNTQLITECVFATDDMTEGQHEATVDVVYDSQRTIKSEPVTFQFVATGIDAVAPETASAVMFDLQGRRVIQDKMGRGLYIINNKKVVR